MRKTFSLLCFLLAFLVYGQKNHWFDNVFDGIDNVVSKPTMVLIVEETDDRFKLTEDQVQILISTELREELTKNGIKMKIWDEETKPSSEKWGKLRDEIELPLPSVATDTGKTFPLPKNVEEFKKLVL